MSFALPIIAATSTPATKILVDEGEVMKSRTPAQILSDIGASAVLSGTTNTVAKFTSSTTIGNSQITDDGTDVFIQKSLHVGAVSGTAGDNNLLVDGTATVSSISDKGSAATVLLTHTTGLIQSRTAAEVLSDIGAAAALSGTTNTVPKFTSSTIIGNSQITDDGTDVFISKSLHIGAVSGTAGDNNLLVDGTATVSSISDKGSTATVFLTHTAGLIQSRTAAELFADIGATTDHTALSNLNSTTYTHLTSANHTTLTTAIVADSLHHHAAIYESDNGAVALSSDATGNITVPNGNVVLSAGDRKSVV
jgi:hypothetical protein